MTRGPARWWTDIGRGKSPTERERARLQQKFYLDRTLRDLRKFFVGFEASDGYDLRHIERLSAQKVRHIKQYGGYLHHLQSSPYVRIAPRSRQQKRVLKSYTAQNLPRQRAYVVHVPDAKKTKVRVTPTGVSIKRQVRGGTLRYEIFFFEEIVGYQPVTFEEIREAIAEMLDMDTDYNNMEEAREEAEESGEEYDGVPLLPEGYYTFYTLPNGSIGNPQPRSQLLRHAHEYFVRYEQTAAKRKAHQDFAEIVLGLQYQGMKNEAMSDLAVRTGRRAQNEERRKLMRRARGKFVTKHRATVAKPKKATKKRAKKAKRPRRSK